MRQLSSAPRSFALSPPSSDGEKVVSLQSRKRTVARASLKVGSALAYHPAARGRMATSAAISLTYSVTKENSPSSAGVVRAIAGSDHCRWVSTAR